MMKTLHLSPNKIAKGLLVIVSVLLLLHLGATFFKFGLGYPTAWGFNENFDFDGEKNIPAFYSAIAILGAAMLLWFISNLEQEKEKKHSLYWKFLSIIFIFLALDEFYSIHERAGKITKTFSENIGSGYLGWFMPYLVILVVVSFFFIRFFFSLPKKTLFRFTMSGIVFVTGAVVLELLGARYSLANGQDLTYTFMYTVEETLEMLGVILFNYALLKYYLLVNATEVKIFWHLRKDESVPEEKEQEEILYRDNAKAVVSK